MKLSRIAAATAATAALSTAALTGLALTSHPAAAATLTSARATHAPARPAHTARHLAPVDPALAWLTSPGGQAQVTFNNDVDTLAGDLQIEAHSPTIANHLIFEADARAVRAQARLILSHHNLLPTHNRAAYQRMLRDFITVANLLQPGPGYGTTAQDYTAWYTALKASTITVW